MAEKTLGDRRREAVEKQTNDVIGKEFADKGWRVEHAVTPEITADAHGNRATVRHGNYVAYKRVDGFLYEQAATSPEALQAQIEDWEATRPLPESEQNKPLDPENALASGIATIRQQVSDGARASGEVTVSETQEEPQKERVAVAISPPAVTSKTDRESGGLTEDAEGHFTDTEAIEATAKEAKSASKSKGK